MFPNAIGIQVYDVKHVFGSFLSRESAFQLMQGMVKKMQMPSIQNEEQKEDEVDFVQANEVEVTESSKEDSSSLSSDSPSQFKIPDVPEKESRSYQQSHEVVNLEVVETTQNSSYNTILLVGIVLTFILAISSALLLIRINSIEARKQNHLIYRDYSQMSMEEAEDILNRNLISVRNVREKLHELQMILQKSFDEKAKTHSEL